MRLLIAALVVTFTAAICATVVATWASVTDAPWEDEVVVVDRTAEIRCEGALSFRNTILAAGPRSRGGFIVNEQGIPFYNDQLEKAEREIDTFC